MGIESTGYIKNDDVAESIIQSFIKGDNKAENILGECAIDLFAIVAPVEKVTFVNEFSRAMVSDDLTLERKKEYVELLNYMSNRFVKGQPEPEPKEPERPKLRLVK